MSKNPKCWCGNTDLVTYSPAYLKCEACGTLVLSNMPDADDVRVIRDQKEFYGRDYYKSHLVKMYGYPDLATRARSDLPERCLHWLRTVLKYKLPPAVALELGSAHGGFVALLRWAGFDATGLELNSWVVDLARNAFGVPILQGSVEDQTLEPDSLDVIAMMDVLEHLTDPVGVMRHCLSLLKSDGILIVQTPSLPENISYEQMRATGDRFLEQLKEKEHMYLFSRHSICQFFRDLGADHMQFEPAIFAHYDMFLIVSRLRLTVHSPEKLEKSLSSKPEGRLVQALLDLDDQFSELKERYEASKLDTARLEQVKELRRLLEESESDREARLEQIEELGELLQESEADRAARLKQIEEMGELLKESEADREARLEQIKELGELLQDSEADRAARLEQIEELTAWLKESESDRAARLKVMEAQQAEIEALWKQLAEESARAQAAEQGWRNLEQSFTVRQARRIGFIRAKRFDLPESSNSNEE